MNRLIALGLALMLMWVMHGGVLSVSPAAAGKPADASAGSPSFTFVQRYLGNQIEISASISANAPIACNARLLLAEAAENGDRLEVTASCRISAEHRNGQRATIRGFTAGEGPNDAPVPRLRCRDAQFTDPESGKVKLRCTFPLEQPEPAA